MGICRQDGAVHGALRTGEWTPALDAHVRECSRCAEAVAISRLMRQAAAAPTAARLPDSTRVWWRARAAVHARDVEQQTRRLALLDACTLSATALAVAVCGARLWPMLMAWAGGRSVNLEPGPFLGVGVAGTAMLVSGLAALAAYLLRGEPR